jgi:hypothetical protein
MISMALCILRLVHLSLRNTCKWLDKIKSWHKEFAVWLKWTVSSRFLRTILYYLKTFRVIFILFPKMTKSLIVTFLGNYSLFVVVWLKSHSFKFKESLYFVATWPKNFFRNSKISTIIQISLKMLIRVILWMRIQDQLPLCSINNGPRC